jgi:uncharacterized DUF497 family protein
MKISYDPVKNSANIAVGRPSFDEVAQFDFQTAVFTVDNRRDYGETRYRGFGFLGQRLHALVFVETANGIRVVSFRKANDREVKRYEKARSA